MNENSQVLELDIIKGQISQRCHFSLGKKLIEELKPLKSKLTIQRANDRLQDALSITFRYGGLSFSGVKDIRDSLVRVLKGGCCSIEEAVWVSRIGHACSSMQSSVQKMDIMIVHVRDLVESCVVDLALSKHIDQCFSPNYEVLDTASSTLKSIRNQLRKMDEDIHRQVNQFIQKNASHLTETISTIRHDRIVVMVKITDKNRFKGVIHGESASGQTAYVEPEFLLALNNKKQSLMSQEEEEIERILWEISHRITVIADQYIANVETLGELDALFAKAAWGKEHNAVVGQLSEKDLFIQSARHPLIDPKQVIANTYRLQPPQRMLLITGPNTGGKTVSLKIIGLFTLSIYCGIPVAALEARVPLFDEVYVDIGDEQSIAQSLSTFSSHLAKIAHITRNCTPKSLILLDELGGGTDPNEGESLAIAILEYLRMQKPMVVATTHYNRLKSYGSEHDDILLASVQFDVEKLQPTYRYQEGLVGSSFAIDIAERFELPAMITTLARQLKEKGKSEQENLLDKLEKQIQENSELKAETIVLNQQATQRLQQYELQISQLEQKEQTIIEQAHQTATEMIQQTQIQAEELLESMRQAQMPHQRIAIKKSIDELIETEEVMPNQEVLAIGDMIKINSTHQMGQIVEMRDQQLSVDVNGIIFKVKKNQVTKTSQKPKKKVASYTKSVALDRYVPFECNVIGLRVEEALPLVDKYIDDCVLNNMSFARIVHGHGTGALRTAIWKHLKSNKAIDEMRYGQHNEGGSGATIITLKG